MSDKSKPIIKSEALTLDTTFEAPTRALWVGAAGDVAVRWADNSTDVIPAVLAGTLLPVSVIQVLTSGTTVSSPTDNIVPMW